MAKLHCEYGIKVTGREVVVRHLCGKNLIYLDESLSAKALFEKDLVTGSIFLMELQYGLEVSFAY